MDYSQVLKQLKRLEEQYSESKTMIHESLCVKNLLLCFTHLIGKRKNKQLQEDLLKVHRNIHNHF